MIPDKKNLPDKDTIWSLANKNDFQPVLDLLSKAGVPKNDLGEVIFDFGNQAFTNNKFNTAITIFIFLTQALEDKSEAFLLFKKIGDIYTFISEHKKAREYYGKLPLTLENIKLCFKTYIPAVEIDELLALRDTVLSKIPVTNHDQIHTIINDIMMTFTATPEIFNSHFNYYKKNLTCVKTIPPFTINSKKLEYDWSSQTTKSWKPEILKLSNTIYLKQNKIWQRIFSNNQKNNLSKPKLGDNTNIMVCCNSPASLFDFINLAKTDNPAFIKYECRVIIDFNLLRLTMNVFDLSPLSNCDFVMRFIDKNNIKAQLTNILLERKLPFTNRVVYLSQGDLSFFSKHVIPTLKECEKKIQHRIEQYEQQLPKIFPNNYKNKIIQKIKTRQKLNVLFFTSRFTTYLQHSIRDIAEGFRQLGHETLIEIEDEDSGVSIRKDVCLENLINFQPDIIFAIDHLRYSYPWVPKSIPFVCWIQDIMPHILSLKDSSLVNSNDYIFSFSQYWIETFFKKHTVFKNKNIYCLPVTVNSKIYYPLPLCKKKYDVTFVTHIPDPGLTLLPFSVGNVAIGIKTDNELILLKQLINDLNDLSFAKLRLLTDDTRQREQLITTICNKINIPICENFFNLTEWFDGNNAITPFAHHIILLMKTKPIKALMDSNIKVRVFGKNWEKIPQFQSIAMGTIKNGTALNKLFNESRINLNLSPGASYHMKAPEVIASKNFMLTRRINKRCDLMPITQFFKENKEIIMVNDERDLIEKIIYFLKNKEKRNEIARCAYHKFIDNYDVKKTAQLILDRLTQ